MMGNWETLRLGEVPIEIIDGDRGKNYPKKSDFSPQGNCLFLNASNVTESGFNFAKCDFISQERDNALRKGKLKRLDVVLTTRGTVGNVAFYDGNVPFENIRINSGMLIFRADRNRVYPRYLYFFMRSPLFTRQAISLTTGSAQPQFPVRDVKVVKIPIPPISEQQAIARVLGTLDDKIDLNRRMNRTLEAIAQAIFKSWFVNFGPVVAKADGQQPYGMNPETTALFPEGFQDSELGPIPEGWKPDKLGGICELAYGKSLPERARQPGGVAVFGSGGQIGWHNKSLVKGPGIVVGRKGNAGMVNWSQNDFFPIDTAFYALSRLESLSLYYLFYALDALDLSYLSGDSAVPGLNRELAYSLDVLNPPEPIVRAFDRFVKPLRLRIDANEKESRSLAAICDALLPRLISGKIRVKQAEKMLEDTL